MLTGLWAALLGLMTIMWENPFAVLAVLMLTGGFVGGIRTYRRSRPAARESKVVKVAFGSDHLLDLPKHDLDCDYYIRAGEGNVSTVFERVDKKIPPLEGFAVDQYGDRWLQTEGDMVVTRNGKVIAVTAASRLESLDSLDDVMEDLKNRTTWRYLTNSTRRMINLMNPLVGYALLLVNDVSTPNNERTDTARPAPAPVQDVPGHPEEEFMGVHHRRPDGSPSGRDMWRDPSPVPPHQRSSGSPQEPTQVPRRGGRLITLD